MSKILITGGAGFVASALCEQLCKNANNQIIVVDNLITGSINKIPETSNVKFVKCDVNRFDDIAGVFYANKFDYVFHYAALVGVKRTLANPVMVLDDIEGINNVLKLSKNTSVKRVFFSSSSEVYGEPVEFPQNEHTTPLNSKLPYAIVKNVGEAFLRSFKLEYNLDYTIFRFFNTFGPKQSKDFVVSKFIKAALKGEDITIYGDGSQTRTFCYVDDNVETCVKCLTDNHAVNDVINVGGAIETTILDLAKTIINLTKSNSKIVHLPALEEGDMTRRMPDNSKMLEILGRNLLPVEEGIKKILADTSYII